MLLTNHKIYYYATQLSQLNFNNYRLPVRISFFLQKNIQTLAAASQEIERVRLEVAQNYGELNADGTQFIVPPHKVLEAQKEIDDLFSLEQDLNIHIFKLDEFDDIELTYEQLSAIMFMIEE